MHEQTIAELERQIGQHTTTSSNAADTDPAETLCMLQADLYTAHAATRTANAALKPIPAKLPANVVDPDAKRATPRVNHRALQTVLQINNNPPKLAGDHRPITYQISAKP